MGIWMISTNLLFSSNFSYLTLLSLSKNFFSVERSLRLSFSWVFIMNCRQLWRPLFNMNFALSTELRIHLLYLLQRGKTSLAKCPGYKTKLHLMVRLHFWRSGSTSSSPLLPGPLWLGVEVPVRILLMGQFKNYLYLIEPGKKKNNS